MTFFLTISVFKTNDTYIKTERNSFNYEPMIRQDPYYNTLSYNSKHENGNFLLSLIPFEQLLVHISSKTYKKLISSWINIHYGTLNNGVSCTNNLCLCNKLNISCCKNCKSYYDFTYKKSLNVSNNTDSDTCYNPNGANWRN